VVTWDDVAAACLALPEAVENTTYGQQRAWRVRDKSFAWERPLRRKDLEELGDAAPAGPVLAASVPDEGAKRALVEAEPDVYFTTHHFDGYAAVLVRLDDIERDALAELVGEAWACRAPKRLLDQYPSGPSRT
jgi:hypothetical protein